MLRYMRYTNARRLTLGLAFGLAAALLLSGCLAVAAGAGAAGAVAFTQRGANAVIDGTVDQVAERGSAVFVDVGIAQTGQATEENGGKRRIIGTQGDLEVVIEMTRASDATTNVEVYARRSAVEYEKRYARDILNRIVKKE
ncbi:MAG: DUF3568 family protein [Gemmatimonadaceae bacterium]